MESSGSAGLLYDMLADFFKAATVPLARHRMERSRKQSPIPEVVYEYGKPSRRAPLPNTRFQAYYSPSVSKAALRRRWPTACAKDSKTARLSSHPAHASVMLTPYINDLPGSKSCRPAFK